MWWVLLAMMAAVQGDAPDGLATETVEDVANEVMAGAELAVLPEVRRREVRCATIANAIMYDVGRGASTRSYGLTQPKAETLAGRLAETLMAETSLSDAEVRAMYKQDFEEFTFALLGEGQDQKAAERAIAAAIDDCQPLYASIDLSGDGDGVVTGLAPIGRMSDAAMSDAAECYALLSHVSIGIPAFKDEAKEFAAMKARLMAWLAKSVGEEAAGAELLAAEDAFSPEAFDSLPEEEAEPRLAQCVGLAAE